MVTFCYRKFLWTFSLVLLVPSLSLFAQQKKYSLSDFVDSSQRHFPALMQKKALGDATKAGIIDARHTCLPTSYIGDELTVGTDNSLPRCYVYFGFIPSASPGLRPSNTAQSTSATI